MGKVLNGRDRFEQGATVLKADVFKCVELLGRPQQERAQLLDNMRARGMPKWLNALNLFGAKACGFVTFEPMRTGSIIRATIPGDVTVKDPAGFDYVVRITALGRELIRANPVSLG